MGKAIRAGTGSTSSSGRGQADASSSKQRQQSQQRTDVAVSRPADWAQIAVVAALLWIASFSIYMKTRYAGIMGGDSGELLAVACQGGVAHPPGYPTYTWLAQQFMSFAPGENAQQRATVLSAVSTSTAGVLLLASVVVLTNDTWQPESRLWAGVCSAGLYLFSPLIWTHATQPEVFALNNLFTAAMLLLLCLYMRRWDAETCRPISYIAAITAGLGMTNQLTFALLLLPAGVVALWSHRRVLSARLLAECVALGAAGLSPYLAMMPKAWPSRPYSWGAAYTVGGLWTHVMRKEYGSMGMTNVKRMQAAGSWVANTALRFQRYFADLAGEQALWVGPALAATGLYCLCRSRCAPLDPAHKAPRKSPAGSSGQGEANIHLVLVAAYVFYLVFFHALANIDVEREIFWSVQARFWQQPNLLVFAYTGPGLAALLQALHVTPGLHPPLVVALVAAQWGRHLPNQDKSAEWTIHHFVMDVLEPLPAGALLVVSGEENYMPLIYMQSCEGVRRDVRVVSKDLLSLPWYTHEQGPHLPGIAFPGKHVVLGTADTWKGGPGGFSLGAFLLANWHIRPVHFLGGAKANFIGKQMNDPTVGDTGLYAWPEGHTEVLYNATLHPSVEALYNRHMAVVASFRTRPNDIAPHGKETWEWIADEAYWNCFYRIGWHLTQYGHKRAGGHVLEVSDRATDMPAGRGLPGEQPDPKPVDKKRAWLQAFRLALDAYQILVNEDRRQRALTTGDLDLDLSFGGYVYKNTGFIHQLLDNKDKMKAAYREFLALGRRSDPNFEYIRRLVEELP